MTEEGCNVAIKGTEHNLQAMTHMDSDVLNFWTCYHPMNQ